MFGRRYDKFAKYLINIWKRFEFLIAESGYVCCPNYPNYATLPSKKPLFPQFPNFTPTAPPTTTTVPTTASATVSTSTTVSPPSSTTVKNESVVVSQEKMKSGCGTFLKQMSTDDNVVGGRYTTRGGDFFGNRLNFRIIVNLLIRF